MRKSFYICISPASIMPKQWKLNMETQQSTKLHLTKVLNATQINVLF